MRLSGSVGTLISHSRATPNQVRRWLSQDPEKCSSSEKHFIAALFEAHPHLAQAQKLVRTFGHLVRKRAAEQLDAWLETAAASGLQEFVELGGSLRQDYDAVKEALQSPWSNGQTEGQITKLKMLKRQMYGRAGLALLRRRMQLAA